MIRTFSFEMVVNGTVSLDLPREKWDEMAEDEIRQEVMEWVQDYYTWDTVDLIDVYET